jgi:hypothetical protein
MEDNHLVLVRRELIMHCSIKEAILQTSRVIQIKKSANMTISLKALEVAITIMTIVMIMFLMTANSVK